MKRQKMHQIVPTLIMVGAAAVPLITTVEILSHVPPGGNAIALQPLAPVAIVSPKSSSSSAGGATLASSGTVKTFQGAAVSDPFGTVQATITVGGKRITNVAISVPQNNPTSASINQQAVPLLQRETLQVQSAQVNTVSGATYTSQAYAQSLQAALDQARRQGNAVSNTPASSQIAAAATTQAPSVSVHSDE